MRYTGIKYVIVRKRKSGSDLSAAIADAVRKRHKKEVHVTKWFLPNTPDVHDISPDATAEELSSQEAEAEVEPVMDPQAQIDSLKTQSDLMMSQLSSDFRDSVSNVASLVMGRLVRPATSSTQAKSALVNTFSKTSKSRQMKQILARTGIHQTVEAFASHFDGLYTARCGKTCCMHLLCQEAVNLPCDS